MANETIAQQITRLEAELVVIRAQIVTANSGVSSYNIGNLSVTKSYSQLAQLRKDETRIQKSLQRLYRGGRGFVVDMSYPEKADDASTSNTVYTRVQA